MVTEASYIHVSMRLSKESLLERQQIGPHKSLSTFKFFKFKDTVYKCRLVVLFGDEKQKNMIKTRMEIQHTSAGTPFGGEIVISYRGVNYSYQNRDHEEQQPSTISSFRGNVLLNVESANFRTTLMENFIGNAEDEPYADICTFEDVFDPKQNFLEGDRLVIKASVLLFEAPSSPPLPANCDALAKRLWHHSNKDFTIIVKNGIEPETEIQVHQCILGAFSTVFDRMLQTEMKEKETAKLILIEFDLETVQTAVEFFYQREDIESKSLRVLLQLLEFAEKYDIPELKAKVESVIQFSIFPHTVCEIANTSTLFNANELKSICLKAVSLYREKCVVIDDVEKLDPIFEAELTQQPIVQIVRGDFDEAAAHRRLMYYDHDIGGYRDHVTHERLLFLA